MSDGRDKDAFWSRMDVRAAIALGYVGLFALMFYPPQSSKSEQGAVATAQTVQAQVAEAPQGQGAAPQAATPAGSPPTAPSAPVAATPAEIEALAKITDYEAARWHPLHFKPAIDTASNEQCLACHKEVLDTKVRETSPAGVTAAQSIAWYQTLDTYQGGQETFHARHMTTPFAKEVMSLKCTFCHQGNDPREEAPGASATAAPAGSFTLRKVVEPSKTCLMCHGKFPGAVMGFEDQPWHQLREGLETPEAPNGCLSCHAEQFRTVRHQVTYLNAAAIEEAAKTKSDVCFGCHGGRSWYRTSYPYPRHAWPGMDPAVPDWAKDRPVESDARYAIKK